MGRIGYPREKKLARYDRIVSGLRPGFLIDFVTSPSTPPLHPFRAKVLNSHVHRSCESSRDIGRDEERHGYEARTRARAVTMSKSTRKGARDLS